MGEPKPVRLYLISTYGQGRMGEPKPVQLSLISTYAQGRIRMIIPDYCIWTRTNG